MCPICAGILCLFGTLGRLVWYRCRDCGTDSGYEVKDDKGIEREASYERGAS